MNKDELIRKFKEAIPDMAKDAIWSSEQTNSLGFIKTKLGGTSELVITLVSDSDDWINDEPNEENTLDLTKESLD